MIDKNKPISRDILDKLMDKLIWRPEDGTITWRPSMAKKEKYDDIKEDKKLIRSMVKAKDLKPVAKRKK